MPNNPWLQHVKSEWAKNKGKMSYKQNLMAAKKTYKRKAPAARPKKKARKAKK